MLSNKTNRMISTTTIISGLKDVPSNWVFEYYLKLTDKLIGQNLRLKSIFSENGTSPALSLLFDSKSNTYSFKDFVTGIGGSNVKFVQELFHLQSKGDAVIKIIQDYNQFLLGNPTAANEYKLKEFKVHSRYKVDEFGKRQWDVSDERYWMQYKIGSKLLEHYQVFPLVYYIMRKTVDNETKELVIRGPRIYGYFRLDGTLYKIYQPMVKECKFITINSYIQGTDQLTMQVPYLLILSSMKDGLAFTKIGCKNAEWVAPCSENTLIPEAIINSYKQKYKGICCLLDDDVAGIKAMNKYQEKYDIPFVHLQMKDDITEDLPFGFDPKDLSDCIKDWGVNKVRDTIKPLLIKTLKL